MTNPGVLVIGLRGMLDQVVPLMAAATSPLCQNLGYPCTNLFNAFPSSASISRKVAVFKTRSAVEIYDVFGPFLSEKEVSCTFKQIDVTGE